MKYHGQRDLASLLAGGDDPPLASWLSTHGAVLVPVPLWPRRQRERGYNQALELANAYAQRFGMPVRDVLCRTRATRPQAQLGRRERLENVRDAFACTGPAPPVVILVDDVATTLSTLTACAEALRRSGAVWVGGLVLARAR